MLFTLSIHRIFNYITLNLSYLLSKLTGSPFLWGKPYSMSIESSGSCQLSCPECPLGNGSNSSRKLLPLTTYTHIIEEIKKDCMVLSVYFQGEAFLNPDIFQMIQIARKAKLYTIISTNANIQDEQWAKKIMESGLNELIISLDGLNQTTYETYRKGGNLELVKSHLEQLSQLSKKQTTNKPKITIQFLVMQHNEHEIPEIRAYAKSLGFKIKLKSIQIENTKNDIHLLPKNSTHRRYEIKEGQAILKNKLKNHCKRLYRNPVITSEGMVLPCCFDKSGKYSFGNINEKGFAEIWKSESYKAFRKNVFSQRKNIDICTNCTEGTKKIYV